MNLSAFNEKSLLIKNDFLDTVKKRVLVVTHKDCDGVCSAYIFLKLLSKLKINYELKFIANMEDRAIYDFAKDMDEIGADALVFLDLGSSYLDVISDAFSDKNVFVFDHHHIKENVLGKNEKNIRHLNLREFGIESDLECCSSSLVYCFVKQFDIDDSTLSLSAVLGAVGDYQMKESIEGLNFIAANDGINKGMIFVSKDLNIYGKDSRYLHKSLARCDFEIPGIKTEIDASNFLKDIGIYTGYKWLKYNELSDDKKKLLEKEILLMRKGDTKGVYSNNVVFLINGKRYDAFEYATILNSQIRMDNEKAALLLCSFDEASVLEAKSNMEKYQIELKNAFSYMETISRIETARAVIINVFDKLRPDLISTVSSMIAKSRKYHDGTVLFIIGRLSSSQSKISCRVCGLSKQNKVNAKQVLSDALVGISNNVGGHYEAAGAVISTIDEENVVEKLKNI